MVWNSYALGGKCHLPRKKIYSSPVGGTGTNICNICKISASHNSNLY